MTYTVNYTSASTTGATFAGDYPWQYGDWRSAVTGSTCTNYYQMPYVERVVERVVEVERRVHKCEYCGSECKDMRGNCGACGAPLK
jgi:hypothetical protein